MENKSLNKESSRWHYLTAIVIMLSSYLIFSDLRYESLWFDEGYTYAVSQLPLDKLTVPFDVHPPLFYIIESFFVKNDGNEATLRLPAALAGIFSVIIVYIIANNLFGSRGAFISTMYIGLSFAHITYSANARNYTLLLFFFFIACAALAKIYQNCINDDWPKRKSNQLLILYFLSCTACLYTHNISVIYLLVLNIVILVFSALNWNRLKKKYITGYILLNILIFICWLPWLSVLIGTSDAFGWLTQPSIILAAKQFLGITKLNHAPLWLSIPTLLGLAIACIYALIKSDDSSKIIIITTLIGIPLAVFGVGYIKPMYMERTILTVLLGISLCLGFFVSNIRGKIMPLVIIGFFTISSAIFAFNYHNRVPTEETIAGKISQDWRSAVGSSDTDEAFIANHNSIPTISFYLKDGQKMFLYDNEELIPVTLDNWNEYFSQPIKQRRAAGSISFTEFLRNGQKNSELLSNKSITMIEIKILNQLNTPIHDFLLRNGYVLKETVDLVGLKLYRYNLH